MDNKHTDDKKMDDSHAGHNHGDKQGMGGMCEKCQHDAHAGMKCEKCSCNMGETK